MSTLRKSLLLAALAAIAIPATANAQFGFFGYNRYGWGSPYYGNSWGAPNYGYGWGSPYYGNSWGTPNYGYGWGSPSYGYGYGNPNPYYNAAPAVTSVTPIIYQVSTATAPPRMRPALPVRDAYSEATSSQGTTSQADRARLNVHVPVASAEVWLDGVRMKQDGTERIYVTPPLDANSDYTMEVEVRWRADDGTPMKRSKRVDLRAGSQQTVDFLDVR